MRTHQRVALLRAVVAVCALIVAGAPAQAQQAQPTLPSMKFLTAPMVSPTAGQTYYGSGTTHSSSFTGVSGFEGRPPEIVELARALKNDPDLIYEFVHNHIDTEFAFGLRKGALGSLIDKSGTPFDQNVLFVEIVRQAGLTARYKVGQVTVSGATFANWAGISDAQAACKMLAAAAIPAAINGASPSDCSVSGAITSVTLLHVWSEVSIGGIYYAFDPSLKTRTTATLRDLVAGSGFIAGAATTAAETTVTTGTQSGVTYIKNVSAAGLDTYLQTRGTQLLNDLKANAFSSDMDAVLGITKIVPEYKPTNGWRNATPAGYTSTSGAVTIAGDIPDQYRTKLTVQLQTAGTADLNINRLIYTDETYGRRLEIDTNFDSAHPINTPPTYAGGWSVTLEVDDVGLQTYTSGVINGAGGPLTLIMDHPYAASGGAYGDQTITKVVLTRIPVAIVAGFGRTSPALLAKWSNEQAYDQVLPLSGSPAYPCYSDPGQSCSNNYASSAGDAARQKAGAGWLAQLTRMVDLQTAISSTRAEHHHSLGVVATRHKFTGWVQDPVHTTGPVLYGINDNFTFLDIDTALSITSTVNNAAKVKAVSRAVALAAATLEGSILEQTEDLPDAASTAARFAWGNGPDEDPCSTGTRRFYDYTGTSAATRAGLFTYEGSATGCAAGPLFMNYLDSALAPFWKGQLETALNAYLTAGGFNVTSSSETFLGPGSRFGQPNVIPQCGQDGGCSYYEKHDLTRQRGGAIVATKADGSGNILEVAHALSDNSPYISKGGAGKEPDNAATFDPNKAADVLKDRFVDRSNALGVDLKTGQAGYTTPTLLSVGNGEAPFSLDFKFMFKPGASGCTPFGPCTGAVQGGWTHNWDIRFSTSGSGLEALGQASPQAASSSLVAFLVMQDIFAQAGLSELKKDVYTALAADWWRRQIQGNVATVTQAFAGRQYVRLVDNTWLAPVGSPGTLAQTGQRAKVRDICRAAPPVGIEQHSVNRRWDHMDVTFTLTEGNGQVLSFAPWKWNWGDDNPCLLSYGYKITSWTWPQGPSLTFATSDSGAVTSVASSVGRTLNISHTTAGLEATSGGLTATLPSANAFTDASGATWNVYYTQSKARSATQRPIPYWQIQHLVEPTAPNKPALEYTYDSRGLVKEAKDAMALQWYPRRAHQFFIAEGARAERQDPQGATSAEDGHFAVYYDVDGNAVRYIDEIGRENGAAYDGRNRVVERTMPEGNRALFEYDARDNLTKLTRVAKPSSCTPTCPPSQIIEAAWHTSWNRPLWIKDQLGRQTDFTYLDTGNGKSLIATALRPAVGGTRPTYTFTYDAQGRVLTATDPTGLVTQNGYDGTNGTPISTVVDPSGFAITTATAYDTVGNAVTVTDARGNATTMQYDNMRRKTAEQNRNGNATGPILARAKLTLDALGRVTKEEKALTLDVSGNGLTWAAIETAYTPTGQKARTTDADGRIATFAYDGLDRLVRTTDPEGRVTESIYDLTGQTLKERRAVGTPLVQDYATYTYSANGQKLTVKDSKNNTTTYTYDGHDRLSRTTFPDSTYEEQTYDIVDNVLSKLTRGGQLIVNTYDSLNRLATHLVPQPGGAPAIVTGHTYDLAGRTAAVSDNGGHSLTNVFDTAKRPSSTTQTAPSFSGTRVVGYQLDAAGNKTRATWADGYYVQYAFDALGRMTTATENGTFLLATYIYDAISRRTSLVYGNGASKSYSYSTHGDLLTLGHTLTGTSAAYTNTYTKAHQLKSEEVSNGQWQFVPAVFQTTAYSAANSLNQYVNVTVGATPAVTLSYDANANLTGDGTWTFAYDAENRLKTANKSGTAAVYSYDPLGRRQAKNVNAVLTTFLSDADEEIAEYDGAASLLRRYVPGPGTDMPIAVVTPSGGGSNTRNYFHTNRQGTTVAMSADNGTISEGPYTYDAYGNGAPTGGVPFKYTGRRLDPETGLYYYRARYYSPSLGRFLQSDPVGYADQMNLYVYANSDPLNATDPTGMTVYYGGVQGELCLGLCISIQVAQAVDDTTGETETLVTVGAGIGIGANGGVVGGAVGRPGDKTNMDNAKGVSVTASASAPGVAVGGTVGATKGGDTGDTKPVGELSGGGGTGGASVTVNNTVSVGDAVEAITTCFGLCGGSKPAANNPNKGTQSPKPAGPKPAPSTPASKPPNQSPCVRGPKFC